MQNKKPLQESSSLWTGSDSLDWTPGDVGKGRTRPLNSGGLDGSGGTQARHTPAFRGEMNEGLNFATDHEQLKSTHPTGQDNAIEGQWMPSASPGNKQPRIQFSKTKQKIETSTKTNEIEGVPSQQQKLDVMIRTIDVHIKSPKDLRYLAPKEVLGKSSIVCVGGKAMEGDSGEFLFMDVGDMAKVVGVGLDWAKVVITKEFGVDVIQEDEGEWTKLWCLEHFVPRIITIPSPKQELVTHPNSTKTNGVELEANLGRVYVEDDKGKIAHACFPLVFELAKHIGLGTKNAMKTKEVSGAESSGYKKGENNLGAESSGSTKGGEVYGEKSNGSRQETRRNEDDEGSEDPFRGPPNPLDPSLSIGREDVEERTLTVNVFPKPRQLAIPLRGRASPPSICPTLVFKFQRKGECKMIDVEAATQCNFGKMRIGATRNGLGFYQDNITISLDCIDEEEDAATVTKAHVQNVENVKKTIVDTSTSIHYSTHQVGGELELDATPLPHNLPLHARGKYNYAWTGGDNLAHGNTQEMYFSQLDCFFVDDQSIQSELRYNFQYPQEVLQDIALGDSSKIKTEKTFWPTIESNWVNLNMNDESPYIFSVERHIVSKEHLKRSWKYEGNPPFTQKRYEVSFNETGQLNRSMTTQSPFIHLTINEGSEVPVIKQFYKVNLKVNHAMTHMHHKAKVIPLRHSDTNPMIVEGVMEMSSSTSE
ncbi:hypothetical protein BDL97_09G100200 [Sphagnum fallax]|nr:hypothetical protein BDL97_09G100200 [Sphagnum fallax]KAH8952742.1 hypothetical protein BDL97_09G100200 [Sphagnum fallax]KAH8952743.1 hypothetical protein BDL97_09G100200 [Sphagnum fallax]